MARLYVDIVTGLPDLVRAPLNESILGNAREKGLVQVRVHDLRDYTDDPHRQIDDYPFGGGGGMVLKPEPVFACIEALSQEADENGRPYDEVIYMTPDGPPFDQRVANELSIKTNLLILAGHYKGVDQRVRDNLITRELSIGDYVLSGGELPALIVLDAVSRLIPGVLGDAGSALSDSFQDDLLGAPVYTRPAEFRGMTVPEALRSGDHRRIEDWRESQRAERTRRRRPDLMID
jgi:tRNA (guanine37-N1)-methyltransferase